MNQKYEPELREKIIRLYLEEGRTLNSLTEEYHLGKGTLRYWLKHTREECDEHTGQSHDIVNISLHFFLEDIRSTLHPSMSGNTVVS
ncbi:hypothetical protein AB840_13545 [Megasphaera cerevisiae DSM 20462]|uniref:Transposase n=1 Tax=Megasphaera cerevisiae DSM 20462 TaxID=1122219 RepID=A0A0J6WTF5_9FIRM|nr:transposase [Megasphaera cerevisiae]KMO85443.1 hypothetical protein AB840_13545 [Megasphaera cerevisiae DSM 20462]